MGGEITREDVLANGESVHHTAVTQVALFVYEYALAQWYRFLGVEPTVMIGHSPGEYVAACIAGVFSLEDALADAQTRCAIGAHRTGAMLAIKQSAEGVREQAAALASISPSLMTREAVSFPARRRQSPLCRRA